MSRALAATALQMHQEKEILTPARGYEISGFFYLLGGYVDKRPYLFAFCTSLLHDLTGYRPFQTVILNTLLTPVFFRPDVCRRPFTRTPVGRIPCGQLDCDRSAGGDEC